MKLTGTKIAELYQKIQKQRPIIHCITNAVTVNDCANILLAAGASPTMAHHPLEAAEITGGSTSLVCNFGAICDYEAMLSAGKRAKELGHAIIVDPVGVSGSTYRREQALSFIREVHPTCIRGNYSEIRALLSNCSTVTGVDASQREQDISRQEALVTAMQQYAGREKIILIASGKTDLITDGTETFFCENGDPMMAKITGSGCMSSAMLGAFLGIEPSVESAAACCAFMGIAGEMAAERTKELSCGTMTFRDQMIDAVSFINEDVLEARGRVEEENRFCKFQTKTH